MSKRTEATPSVLLGANSAQELHALAARLETAPDSVCGVGAHHCVIVPEACSASVEIEIIVNSVPGKTLRDDIGETWRQAAGTGGFQPRLSTVLM